jgi:probable F420-dependent oxidoreductase
VTSTVRLSTRILIAPLRPAALLAKTAATIDQLSGGRLDLGVGTGWQREEFDAEGLDFESRGQLLTDTITACRALWTETPASVATPSISFEGIYCEPKPAQRRLPVWFGGVLHSRNLRRIVELGDGWIPIMNATVDDVAAGALRLRDEAERLEHAPFDVLAAIPIARSDDGVPDLARTMAAVPGLVEAGATDLHVSLSAVCRSPEQARGAVSEIVSQFRSATRS